MMGPNLDDEKFVGSVRSREELLQGLRVFRDLLSGVEANLAVPEPPPEAAEEEEESDGTDSEGGDQYDMRRRGKGDDSTSDATSSHLTSSKGPSSKGPSSKGRNVGSTGMAPER